MTKKMLISFLFLSMFQSFGMAKLLLEKQKIQYTIENQGLDCTKLFEPSCLEDYKTKITNELNSPWRRICYLTTNGIIPLATGISLGFITYKLVFGNACNRINHSDLNLAFRCYLAATACCFSQAMSGIERVFTWKKEKNEKLSVINKIMDRFSAEDYKNYKLMIKQREINEQIDSQKAKPGWRDATLELLNERRKKFEGKNKSRWEQLCTTCSKAQALFWGTCYSLAACSLFIDNFSQEKPLNRFVYKIVTPTVLATMGSYVLYNGMRGIYKNIFYWHRNKSKKLIMANSAYAEARRLSDPSQQAN